jgi:hypothetical protein
VPRRSVNIQDGFRTGFIENVGAWTDRADWLGTALAEFPKYGEKRVIFSLFQMKT